MSLAEARHPDHIAHVEMMDGQSEGSIAAGTTAAGGMNPAASLAPCLAVLPYSGSRCQAGKLVGLSKPLGGGRITASRG